MKRRQIFVALAIAILLLGAAVRFHRLGEQSLWYDEGVAYAHSLRSLPELIPLLRLNVHVPAYFILLGIWQDLTGSSEFALRSLSALFSVISIAWAYALGRRLFHPVAGLAAAALLSLNSFSIYYAQELRMYAMLTAIAGASIWLFLGFIRRPTRDGSARIRWSNIIPLGLLNALGIYTHVVYALVIATQVVAAALWIVAQLREAQRSWGSGAQSTGLMRDVVIVNLLSFILFLPWLPDSLLQVFSRPNLAQSVADHEVLRLVLGNLAYGSAFEFSMGNTAIALWFILFSGLLLSPTRRRLWWEMLLPVIWVLLAVASYLYLDLTTRYLRFLLPAQLAFSLWIGHGVWMLWTSEIRLGKSWLRFIPKLAALIASGAILLSLFGGLDTLYRHPDFQRDDMRGLARRIQADLGEDDAVIVSAAGVEELLRFYYDADAPVFGLPVSADDALTRRQVKDINAAHRRIHVIFYGATQQDPNQIVESTLNLNAYEISDSWIDDLRYVQYVSPAKFDEVVAADLAFGDGITLKSYALSSDRAQRGDALQARLVWRASETPIARYKVFLQLLSAEGTLVAQRDSEPAGGSAITTLWQPAEDVVDNHALLIPPDIAPGAYLLIAGLYDISDPSARLTVEGQTYVELGTITVN